MSCSSRRKHCFSLLRLRSCSIPYLRGIRGPSGSLPQYFWAVLGVCLLSRQPKNNTIKKRLKSCPYLQLWSCTPHQHHIYRCLPAWQSPQHIACRAWEQETPWTIGIAFRLTCASTVCYWLIAAIFNNIVYHRELLMSESKLHQKYIVFIFEPSCFHCIVFPFFCYSNIQSGCRRCLCWM